MRLILFGVADKISGASSARFRLSRPISGGGARARLPVLAAIAAVSILFALQIFRGSVLYERWFQDIFIHLNGILHIKTGNSPHVGFGTPIGAFYYLVFYLPTIVTPASAYTAVHANAIVAILVMGFASWAGYRRLPPLWTAIVTLYVGVLAISPRHLGELYISFNASYNRWSWAIIAVFAVLVSLPRSDSERSRAALADGVLAGILLTLLFFTKATYFVVGAGLMLASLVTVRRYVHPWIFGLVTAGVGALLIIMAELIFGIVFPYLSDLHRAAQAQGGYNLPRLTMILYTTFSDHVLILCVAAVAAVAVKAQFRISWFTYLLTLIGAGLAIAAQNNPANEIPLVPVTALIGLRMLGGRSAAAKRDTLYAAASAAALLLFLRPLVFDTLTIVEESMATSASGADVDWLRTTPMRDLAFRPAPNTVLANGDCLVTPPRLSEDREYLSVLKDGVRLLDKQNARGSSVLSLTWTNPFPALTGGPPVTHELAWWDPGRSFSRESHPSPKLLLQGVDYVLIPKFEYFPQTSRMMMSVYGSEIQRRYRLIDESGCWRLMGGLNARRAD